MRRWATGNDVSQFASRTLLPVEVVILARYREALSRRVLEIGCGGGRILGYLVALGGEVHGIDISARMVDYCRQRYPRAQVQVGDAADLAASAPGSFDAIVAADNILDAFDHPQRLDVLRQVREALAPDGLLIFSSHNLEEVDAAGEQAGRQGVGRLRGLAAAAAGRTIGDLVRQSAGMPRRIANRRRLAPLERREEAYAILNDSALQNGLLHYYIGSRAQREQLESLGLSVLEILDPEGEAVGEGEAPHAPWLHYVARRSRGAAGHMTPRGGR